MNERPLETGRLAALLAASFLAAAALATYAAYRLGLPGDFMFDDFPNLQALASHGGVHDLARLRLFLEESFAGPTGRPISMLSFLVDVRDWPAAAGPLKVKNVLIHLLNGVLLFWAVRSLLLARGWTGGRASWVAALASAWWLLHPLHVSTVLYTIQRMAELSALFVFAGIVVWVEGRRRLNRSPRLAYALMGTGLTLGTVLGTLSKENGALLPLLVLVLEATVLRGVRPAPAPTFRAIFLVLPTLAVIGYLLWSGFSAKETWQLRSFGMGERLLTEARILFIYLRELLLPRPDSPGLFPAITVSRSLLEPPTTLPAVIGVLALAGTAFALRGRIPLLSAAALFFLAGHIMESTVLPLELYFEHRNYLPSAFLGMPLASGIVWLWDRQKVPAAVLAAVVTISLAGLLAYRAEMWGDRTGLYLRWAERHPTSTRAQLAAINVVAPANPKLALSLAEEAVRRLPNDLALRLHLIRLKIAQGRDIGLTELADTAELAKEAAYSNEAVVAMRRLTDLALRDPGRALPWSALEHLWKSLLTNPDYSLPRLRALAHHYLGRLALRKGDAKAAIAHFRKAGQLAPEAGMHILQSALLATAGRYCEALAELDEAAAALVPLPAASARVQRYEREIKRLRNLYRRDARSAGISCSGVQSP